MEKKLSALFDYQRFAGNRRLQEVIDSMHRRSREALSMDEAELVAAAGAPYQPTNDDKKGNPA